MSLGVLENEIAVDVPVQRSQNLGCGARPRVGKVELVGRAEDEQVLPVTGRRRSFRAPYRIHSDRAVRHLHAIAGKCLTQERLALALRHQF